MITASPEEAMRGKCIGMLSCCLLLNIHADCKLVSTVTDPVEGVNPLMGIDSMASMSMEIRTSDIQKPIVIFEEVEVYADMTTAGLDYHSFCIFT